MKNGGIIVVGKSMVRRRKGKFDKKIHDNVNHDQDIVHNVRHSRKQKRIRRIDSKSYHLIGRYEYKIKIY